MTKKILILAANPRGDLRLDYEIKDLKDAIKRNEKFDVEIELAVNAESIDNLIAENQPLIVHFCGHGAGKQGLVVDKEGIEQSLSNDELANIFKSYGEGIECVLLNACYTEVQADVIAEYIPYVIGTSREILDKVAHYFSIGFYKGIAEEQPIETCYEWGYVSIKSNLENAEVVTSIDEINGKSRKLEVVNDGTVESTVQPLEIILKHNKFLESQFASNVSPQLEQEFIEEGRRKRYKDNLRNILDNFGQRIIHREKQISEFEFKQRGTLIDKVQEFWLGDFLQKSLYFNTAIDTDKDNPSGQILRPLDNLEIIPFDIEESYNSVKDTDIPDQISDGQTLLILGEPGSGKTIALLQLAERLVAESRENFKKPIPVVFNLSSWVEKQQSLEEWLIEELRDKYQVPKALSQPWIKNQELTLLLDGLDEVKANNRNACVKAIRKFSNTHQATEMVVCSRIKDYEALAERLLLSTVICIQPLSKQQLLDFLENADDSLSGLKTVIEQDAEIFQFATTPLILNMMTWTYHGWSTKQCYEKFRSPGDREFNLFESYINKNLNREDIDKKYSQATVLLWLNWLASTMVDESKIIFLIEKMQPTLLQSRRERIFYRIRNFLLGGLIYGLIGVLFFGLMGMLTGVLTRVLFFGLKHNVMVITLFEKTSWSWQKAKSNFVSNLIRGLSLSLIGVLIFGLIVWLIFGLMEMPLGDLTIVLTLGLIGVLIFGLTLGLIGVLILMLGDGIISNEVIDKTLPNQGIWSSGKNAIKYGVSFGLIGVLIFGLIVGLIVGLIGELTGGLSFWLIVGLIFGLIGGENNGGFSCIQHFNLRRILYKQGLIPWNYAHFLDYASDLLLMKKIGGGYVFYHRMLMEHFASMELEK
ncbi:MAG: NACHT domain-containing protein [Cyanobacteria bacterium P01_G01_bin.39]